MSQVNRTVPMLAGPVLALPDLEGYDIIDLVGRGGMGLVYEAFQQSTGRRVAVKLLLNEAESTDAARQRFEREVEFAARLQHPAIVSIIDSGIHRGRYFYVMEYVDGRPLDQALQPGRCDPRAALALMAEICEAVDYAHQRGVLHRDLKPDNILVVNDGGPGIGGSGVQGAQPHQSRTPEPQGPKTPAAQPKVLDFGLAKAIGHPVTGPADASLSEPGQLLGTLAYMSPEQSRGALLDLSVRSDVFSLGAIAYELLTGAAPCDTGGALADVLARIAFQDPVRPSSLRRGLGPDIDAILLKALEKAPIRRYATAAEMAADIRRFLAHETILARRASAVDRLRRLIQRHRAVTAVVATSAIAISGILVRSFQGISRERDRAREQAQLARLEADRAKEISDVLAGLFGSVDPNVAHDPDFTARDMLDHFSARLAAAPMRNPEVEASIRERLGRTYLVDFDEDSIASDHLESALSIRRSLLRPPNEDIARTMLWLAAARVNQMRNEEAEQLNLDSLAMRRALFAEESAEVAESLQGLGRTLHKLRRFKEAEATFRRALETQIKLLGEMHRDTAMTHNNYANLLIEEERFYEGMVHLRASIDATRRLSPESWEEASSLSNLARCVTLKQQAGHLISPEEFGIAWTSLCEALCIRRGLFGDDDNSVKNISKAFAELLGIKEPLSLANVQELCREGKSSPSP